MRFTYATTLRWSRFAFAMLSHFEAKLSKMIARERIFTAFTRFFRHSPLSLRFGRKLWNFHYEFSAEIFLWHRMWRLLFLPHCILLIIARQWNDIITFCRSTKTNSSSTEIRSFYLKCKKKTPHIKNENVNFSPDFEQPFVNEY